ncbi:MAG: murein L,D-transpeptidase catalytic domain family protein [Myxococcales bacterium]|nr:murein L,D-transpeptidase catalytic domain family protein [Myxococcales bacterium]
MLLRAPLRALALALALAATACSAEVGPEDDAAEEADGEGGEQVSEEALRLGDANRQGFKEPQFSAAEKAAVLARYGSIDPNREVPRVLLENALQYYDFNKSRLKVKDVITIIDFSQHSSKRRMYIVDMETGRVERHVVAHGSGSDPENDGTPRRFSNVEGSLQSSLGYYVTAETYEGKWGYSLRLDGLSATNSQVRKRAVVMHGASYVVDGKSLQGRSWGCPAIPMNERTAIINQVKGGSLLYADLPNR